MGANSNNVNTTSKIIKSTQDEQPYQLGNFVSNNQSQSEQMRDVAVLDDRSINGNVDPVLSQVHNLEKMLMVVQEKITLIENNGVVGRDIDRQVVEALKDLKHYASFFEQATFQMESKLLKTSFSIAKKIIAIEVGENSSKIAKETILGMMDKIKASSKVTIHLNPKDYVILKEQLNFESFVSLQEDINVMPGGVVVASDLGNFDGNIESKIQSMLESLDPVI